MEKEERIAIFKEEIDWISSEDLKNFACQTLSCVPDYFFSVPASSTGKYHPDYAAGKGGLVRHTKAAMRFAHHLFALEMYQEEFNQRQQDMILVALLLHDTLKHGTNGSKYTTFDHPIQAAHFVFEEPALDGFLSKSDRKVIALLIGSHMGQWTTSNRSSEVLPKPKSSGQKFVHMCDYLASRKGIELQF